MKVKEAMTVQQIERQARAEALDEVERLLQIEQEAAVSLIVKSTIRKIAEKVRRIR